LTTSTQSNCTPPSHWDIGFIRRVMIYFDPVSSLFDFLTAKQDACSAHSIVLIGRGK
jgi:hypothetical protein